MEKQANNLVKYNILKTLFKSALFATLFFCVNTLVSQELSYENGAKYTLGEISVKGNTTFSAQTIITYSGLRKGSEVQIPGEDISNAIKKLWNSDLFSDIEVYLLKTESDLAFLEIRLSDLPELNEVVINGIRKGKKETLINENNLTKGVKVTENLITTTRNYLESKYRKQGFLGAKVKVTTNDISKDSTNNKLRTNLFVGIDKGSKVKVSKINFEGNEVLTSKKLRKSMKNTKQVNPVRVLKRSKFIESDYNTDLISIVDKYKESGYRDARIISDTLIKQNDSRVSLDIKIEEGDKYYYGDISFIGNTVYSDETLRRTLGVEKGDVYNGIELQKRIADNSRPDANDITNMYQNNGYLFSTINPVEINASGNVIDIEIRISEGKPVYFNKVTVVGNDKTNDHVIYREIRTRPGELYSKEKVVRTVRELSQLGFFDAEQLSPNFKNPNPEEGTIDMEYSLVEAGSSQIELQGGYGGGGFIGTLGLSFNNFSLKDIFKKDAYKPLPMGDGQKLSLRLQASRFFRTYSFSFTEPWMGGKKPVQFSTSISQTQQFLFDPSSGTADKNRRFNITGLTVGLAKRLSIPDDYFTLSQALSFQHYNLKNYNTGLFTFGDGYSNNLAYTVGLSRNNTFNDPIFPTGGSSFSATAKFSLPYSLLNGVDYTALKEERDVSSDVISDSNNSIEDRTSASARIAEIDQERFKWLEFYKVKFKVDWYSKLVGKFVLKPSVEFGFLGAYNQDRGVIPFERFFVGGDGLGAFSLDGREAIALRGYPNQSIQPEDDFGNVSQDGGTIYNKFSMELRYPITLKQSAKIYALGFLEAGGSYNEFKDYDPFALNRSAGLGVRIFMPAFGLLGIDFGHGFDPIPGQSIKSGWQTHFIIGQQF
ncbi:outer membrane protein assembly factor [Aurantibacter sp.]|uniref:BamA/OMP85 family outer membrane protein n=1 Tax=Aurantibacter sp. TaxID=2807103 RepID=UPI0035C7A7A6